MEEIRNRIKISINKLYHDNYNSLKFGANKSYLDSPFEDLREIFLVAAAVGVKNGRHVPLESNKEGIFDSNVFNEHFDLPLLYTIAFSHEKNSELLSDDSYVLKTVEAYANGGFPILWEEISKSQSNNLMNLAIYLNEIEENQS